MAKILFIINPIAGGGRAAKLVSSIEKLMESTRLEYSIVLTKKPKEASILSKQGLGQGYDRIIAVGGDGTVNEVALGIMEYGKGVLGIIPCGTGNDLARTIGIPTDLEKAITIIINGKIKKMDVGMANDNLFLNISSIGLDSEVVKNTEKIKSVIKSNLAYLIALIFTLFSIKPINIALEIDSFMVEKTVFLIAVGNGKFYGGGLEILPMAIIDDGYFHICLVNTMSRLKLLILLPTLLKGQHIKHKKYVEVLKGKEIRVITDANSYLNIDGELKNLEKEVLFLVRSGGLNVLVDKRIEPI